MRKGEPRTVSGAPRPARRRARWGLSARGPVAPRACPQARHGAWTGYLRRWERVAPVLLVLAAPGGAAQAGPCPAAAGHPAGLLALSGFWPDLSPPTLAWFAAVVILALTLRLRPMLTLRNLDALVLVGMCLLVALRGGSPAAPLRAWGPAWWASVGLTASAVYWLVRGAVLLRGGGSARHEGNVSRGAMVVLLSAALAVGVHQLATAPISDGSRDGIIGGLCLAETGRLPYGDAPGFETRSPLLYLVHAGAVWAVPPILEPRVAEQPEAMLWDTRDEWLATPWLEQATLTAARLVNAVFFVLMLVGLLVIGRFLRSAAVGPTMVAIFCVFPGALECLPRPEIMLPTVLLTWTIAFALMPAVGGLLATLTLTLAGAAWPWAWPGLPVLLAYFWRRGWPALGSSAGLLAGGALIAAGLLALVRPGMPRADGALAIAGERPAYTVQLAADGVLVIDRRDAGQPPGPAQRALSAPLWRWLLRSESVTLPRQPGGLDIDWPNAVSGEDVLFREVAASPEARAALQPAYRSAVGELPWYRRLPVALRTVLEATWVPVTPVAGPVPGAWALWAGPQPLEGGWVLVRRLVKVAVGLLAVVAAVLICLGQRTAPRHLVAGLLAVGAGSLLASASGAVTNLVWLLPAALALWALHEVPESKIAATELAEFQELAAAGEDGPAPRITYEN